MSRAQASDLKRVGAAGEGDGVRRHAAAVQGGNGGATGTGGGGVPGAGGIAGPNLQIVNSGEIASGVITQRNNYLRPCKSYTAAGMATDRSPGGILLFGLTTAFVFAMFQ